MQLTQGEIVHFIYALFLSPEGLVVDVLVGLDGDSLADLLAAGQPLPPPLQARAIVDTGCDVTAISAVVVQVLGLKVAKSATTQTAGGSVRVDAFEVSLTLPIAGGSLLVHNQLIVTELAVVIPNIDVLIGLDVLKEGLLVLDGPGKQFTLAF